MDFPTVVVAGHLCVDLVPMFSSETDGSKVFVPGTLAEVGELHLCTGGCVSNTGLALHKLGVPVRLVGKIGTDFLGGMVAELYREQGPELDRFLVSDPNVLSSYTLVFNTPGLDRCFLHCPGANASFSGQDVNDAVLDGGRWLHFGYPPLMERIGTDGGADLLGLLRRAHRLGLGVSLDMAYPDPAGATGGVDWRGYMASVLPEVDVFAPSIDEIQIMLGAQKSPQELSEALLSLGAKVVLMKLGEGGVHLRTAGRGVVDEACRRWGADPERWADLNLSVPCFQVDVMATSGSGDSTIAGFLAGILAGQGPVDALRSAVGTGACSVEGPDAASRVQPWDALQQRIQGGWTTRPGRFG